MHALRSGWIVPGVCAVFFAVLIGASGLAGVKKPARAPKTPSFPLNLWAEAKPADYLGSETCSGCHPQRMKTILTSDHWQFVTDPHLPKDRQGCEACHGPGTHHLENLGDTVRLQHIMSYSPDRAEQASQACLRCHQSIMRTSEWHRTVHARAGIGCVSCHQIHQEAPGTSATDVAQRKPNDAMTPIFAARPDPHNLLKSDEATLCGSCHRRVLNEFQGMTHHPLQEGRIVCSDCHTLHPNHDATRHGAAPTRLRNDHEVSRQVCVTCHPETAGPFAYEHDPAAGWTGSGCTECHRPHGSPNPFLLKAFSRGMCVQCHTDKAATHYPGRTCWDAIGCHVAIHGSNTDQHFLSY